MQKRNNLAGGSPINWQLLLVFICGSTHINLLMKAFLLTAFFWNAFPFFEPNIRNYFLFGLLLIPNSLIKSSNKAVSVGSNISHFPS